MKAGCEVIFFDPSCHHFVSLRVDGCGIGTWVVHVPVPSTHVFEVWLEEEIAKALKPFQETMSLFQTGRDVSLITAAAFVAVLATWERFPPVAGSVVSYIGFLPLSWGMGGSDAADTSPNHAFHVTELGQVLCVGAHHASRIHNPIEPYFERVCAKHGYKRDTVAIAQRLAGILCRTWLSRPE